MRILLDFSMEENFIPLDYHRFCIKFIKNALTQYQEGRHYNQFYGEEALHNGEKNFSFSVRFRKPTFHPNRIEVEEKGFSITFVCPSLHKSALFFAAFMEQRYKSFAISEHNVIKLHSLRSVADPKVKGNLAHLRLQSPLLLRLHDKENNKDQFLHVQDESFLTEWKTQLSLQHPEFVEAIAKMQIDTSGLKKTVVKFYNMQISATVGEMKLLAEPALLNKLLCYSVGSKRSAGFGVLQLLDSWEMIL